MHVRGVFIHDHTPHTEISSLRGCLFTAVRFVCQRLVDDNLALANNQQANNESEIDENPEITTED